MIFNSMIFLWVFLPIVFIADKAFSKCRMAQNVLLLAVSLLFYAWGQPDCLVLLLLSVLGNYVLGLVLDRTEGRARATLLGLGIAGNLVLLGYYKYFNFFGNTLNKVLRRELIVRRDLVLPVGISFFTFQAITYLIDLYKKKYPAQKNILYMALYFSFFPKVNQGPIDRYVDFAPQIENRVQSMDKIGRGVRRFLYGMAKKVLIADVLGACVARIYGMAPGNVSSAFAWIAAIFYALQLYYDFSGYTDMAVGLGLMFGFDLTENFNYPYLADSVTDFWRRWHMSLTAWFREYLYFPLGGSRKGQLRTVLNILIIYMATGLWHGASWDFIFWGMYHGFFQILERLWLGKYLKRTKIIKHIYTLLVVSIGWIVFSTGDLGVAFQFIKRMLLFWRYTTSNYAVREIITNRAVLMCIAGVIGCGPIQAITGALEAKAPVLKKWRFSWLELAYCLVLFAACVFSIVSSTYTAFLYMTF